MEAHLICNNCGGRYQTIETDSPDDNTTFPDKKFSAIGYKNKVEIKYYRYQCPVCGAVKPKISYNEENELTYLAFQLLAESKFDEADAAFDEVLAKYPENAEAYWGKVKAKYRVIYKENAKGKMVPTCEKTNHGSVFKDENYQKAYEYADDRIKAFLKKQANEIDRVRGIKQKKAIKILTPILLLVIALGLGLLFRPSKLSYKVNADNLTCTITGIGTCKDTDIRIPETIDGYKVTGIGASAFRNCTSLTSIVIPDSVTSIGTWAFAGCNGLTSIVLSNGLTSIGSYAFYYCTSLTSIVIPDSVTSIGRYAFEDCTSLTSIEIPDSVTSIDDSAFYNCTSLTSIALPEGLTSIGSYAFYYCTRLTSIVIPDSVTSIGTWAFADCTSLTSIVIPDGVTSIGASAFRNCTSLTSIVIPDSVTLIGDDAFYNCKSLTSIVIPNGVTRIGRYAFLYCTSLTSIVIPDSVTSIGDSAFYYCTSLTSIELPDSVTSIGSWTFAYCESLTSIVIPNGVTSIGRSAFYGCEKLTEIRYNGTTAQWQKISKSVLGDYYTGNYTVICTDGTIAKNGTVTPN